MFLEQKQLHTALELRNSFGLGQNYKVPNILISLTLMSSCIHSVHLKDFNSLASKLLQYHLFEVNTSEGFEDFFFFYFRYQFLVSSIQRKSIEAQVVSHRPAASGGTLVVPGISVPCLGRIILTNRMCSISVTCLGRIILTNWVPPFLSPPSGFVTTARHSSSFLSNLGLTTECFFFPSS